MAAPDLIKTIDEFEAEYRKGIGAVLPHHPTKGASLDNIRNFCEGIGDYNPLWRDEEHARNSRFGMITAPPSFLYSVALGVTAGETGNIDRARVSTQYLPVNYAGVEIDFVRPVWLEDRITVTEKVGETIRKTSGRIGAINFNTGLVAYTNQRHETVATFRTLMARYENTGGTLQYDRKPKGDDAETVNEAADPLVWERERRGAETRYWEDVAEGDEMLALKKGTYSVSELFLVHPWRSRAAAQHPGSPRRRGIRGTRRWRPFRSGARPEATQHAGPVRLRSATRLLAVPDRDGLDGGRRHAQEAQRFGTPSQYRRRYEHAHRFRGEEVHRRWRAPGRSADAEQQSVGTYNRVRHGDRRATDARLAGLAPRP